MIRVKLKISKPGENARRPSFYFEDATEAAAFKRLIQNVPNVRFEVEEPIHVHDSAYTALGVLKSLAASPLTKEQQAD